MFRSVRSFAAAALLSVAACPPPATAAPPGGAEQSGENGSATAPKTILLIAGPDDDHPAGSHEYAATVQRLADLLADSNVGESVRIETAVGWPADESLLDRADCLFVYSAGGNHDEKRHPLLVGDRWERVEAAAARGCGVVLLHWSTFLPDRLHDAAMTVVGGRFDYEGGPPPKRWESRIDFAEAPVSPVSPTHPVAEGVAEHTLHDEFYHHLAFPKARLGWTPLLSAPLPGAGGKNAPQTVAWALERATQPGGPTHRAVGFSGGHFEKNLTGEETSVDHRRFLLNALAWTAGLEVPTGGVRTFNELWTPVSRKDAKRPYEKEKEHEWVDGRIREMDQGPFAFTSLTLPGDGELGDEETGDGERGGGKIVKALVLKVPGSPGEHLAVDTVTGVARCGWTGAMLEHSERRFGLIDLPTAGAKCDWTLPADARWTVRGEPAGDEPAGDEDRGEPRGAAVRYLGLNMDGPNFVLQFEIAGEPVRLAGDAAGVRYECGPGGSKLTAPPGGPAFEVRSGPPAALPTDPAPRWGNPLVTAGRQGEPIAETAGAFAIDSVDLPFRNPHDALLFLSGLGFAPDGTAYVAAAHGDVWQVRGLGGDLSRVEWRRFATGLYQPLGLAVRGDEVFALGRDRLTRLVDVNGDGEADRYESFNADLDILGTPHAYAMGLETDAAGNFYFLKSGSAQTKQGGCLVQITADGTAMNVVATGFRHPNGIGLSPQGSPFAGFVTAADNEGNWVPATPLHMIDPSGAASDARAAQYYAGFVPTAHREATISFDPPALWMPRAVCTSAGGQCWVPCEETGAAWGPLAGAMLHLSYGRCTANLVLTEELHASGLPRAQGAVMPLPGVKFLAGVCRGRFYPGTADLWVCGLDGWQTAAVRDGCLQRLRRTEAPLRLPTAVKVHDDGLELRFAGPLAKSAADPAAWEVEAWTYRRGADYGSPELRPSDPRTEGHDLWPVRKATLSPDKRGVFLSIRRLEPVMQYAVRADLTAPNGDPVPVRLFGTIHHAGDAWGGWTNEDLADRGPLRADPLRAAPTP